MHQWGVLLEKVRQIHNHYPGPPTDPGRWGGPGSHAPGFKYGVTDEPKLLRHRCHCGVFGELEHYGTIGYVDEHGDCWSKGRRVRDMPITGERRQLRFDGSAAAAEGGEVPWE
jgi:hypothetical protein